MNCKRCGIAEDNIVKRVERGGEQMCASCNAKPAAKITTAHGVCKPHRGQFDDEDNPLDDKGRMYRPGWRRCGFKDCCERSHIVAWAEVTQNVKMATAVLSDMERLKTVYRDGVKLTPVEMLEQLEGERVKRKKGHK